MSSLQSVQRNSTMRQPLRNTLPPYATSQQKLWHVFQAEDISPDFVTTGPKTAPAHLSAHRSRPTVDVRPKARFLFDVAFYADGNYVTFCDCYNCVNSEHFADVKGDADM